MKNIRIYGNPPYQIALIHGGPGAAGEMSPVAKELSADFGVLEPMQTEMSVDGQINELKTVLQENADLPVILIGFSWGAWLSLIFAARYPDFVSKLILVSCGSLEEKYAADIEIVRMSRLNVKERAEMSKLLEIINDPEAEEQNEAFARFGKLCTKADAYDPVDYENATGDFRVDIFRSVWIEAEYLRQSRKLLEYASQIQCPITAIHGECDPHQSDGVKKPLAAVTPHYRWILLERCGHKPWIERQAGEEFYRVLRNEMSERD